LANRWRLFPIVKAATGKRIPISVASECPVSHHPLRISLPVENFLKDIEFTPARADLRVLAGKLTAALYG
jgi:hypothetical protein